MALYTVLVASDASPAALRAIDHAIGRVRARGDGQVHVLSVLDAVSEDTRQLIPAAEIERVLAAEAATMRSAVAPQLEASGVPHAFEALPGEPAPLIVERARVLGADEIVMGTRGRGPVSGLILGSVAARVVQLAHCPVTVVR